MFSAKLQDFLALSQAATTDSNFGFFTFFPWIHIRQPFPFLYFCKSNIYLP